MSRYLGWAALAALLLAAYCWMEPGRAARLPAAPPVQPDRMPDADEQRCPDGGCPPARPSPWGPRLCSAVAGDVGHEWRREPRTGPARMWVLWRAGREAGYWDVRAHHWVPRIPGTDRHGPPTQTPPVDLPPEARCGGRGHPEPQLDLLAMPAADRPRNRVGTDRTGLCTFAALHIAARWQHETRLRRFLYQMQAEPGGGEPRKVAAMIRRYGPGTRWATYEGRSLRPIELALASGRAPCIAWEARDGRGHSGWHMLNAAHLDATTGAILDNNDPGRLHWMSRAEFVRRYRWVPARGLQPWIVVLLAPAPPPPPRNTPRTLETRDCGGCDCGCAEGKPCGCTAAAPIAGGMLTGQWGAGERYSLCGRPCSQETWEAAIADGSRPHLTVIGDERTRAETVRQLEPLTGLFRVHSLGPGAWQLRHGHVTGGHPTVYLQAADGQVLCRDDGQTDPETLCRDLRRAVPDYDPARDPRPGGPLAEAALWVRAKGAEFWAVVAAALGAAWYFTRQREQTSALAGQAPPAAPPAPAPAPAPAPPAPAPAPAGAPQTQAAALAALLAQAQPAAQPPPTR